VGATPVAAAPILTFGMSPTITLPADTLIGIPAAIINISPVPIAFGCVSCPGGDGISAGLGGTLPFGLGPLRLEFGNAGNFSGQFDGLVLNPGARFDFTFITVNFDDSQTSSVTAAVFVLYRDYRIAPFQVSFTVSDSFTMAPFVFSELNVPQVVPEPASGGLLLLGCALAYRRRIPHRPRI
jgi:hypothetical protein